MNNFYNLIYSIIMKLNKTIRTDAQSLTTAQKQQVRSNIGAMPDTYTPPNQTAVQVGADPKGTAASAVSSHNTSNTAHSDIRQLMTQLNSGKVNVADIANNLTTNVTNKPLSAAQGVALKALIDAITIPTKLSQLTNDQGYITDYTETDPTVPAWAKAANKPSYTKSEVGLGNVDNVKQYSTSNPPPYPVTSVNGKTGAVTLDAAAVGARPSTWMPSASDVGARPSTWTPTAANVGAVPTSRKVNGKALSCDITLAASDVGAVPTTQAVTVTGVDADGVSHSWTMYGVEQ